MLQSLRSYLSQNHRWRNHSSVPLSCSQKPPFRDMSHIYDLGRQVKVCYKAAVSVFSKILLILKKIQLLDLLSCSFGALLNFLPNHHYTSEFLPTVCLIDGFGYFQSVRQLNPFALMGKTVLYAIVKTAGDKNSNSLFFE